MKALFEDKISNSFETLKRGATDIGDDVAIIEYESGESYKACVSDLGENTVTVYIYDTKEEKTFTEEEIGTSIGFFTDEWKYNKVKSED